MLLDQLQNNNDQLHSTSEPDDGGLECEEIVSIWQCIQPSVLGEILKCLKTRQLCYVILSTMLLSRPTVYWQELLLISFHIKQNTTTLNRHVVQGSQGKKEGVDSKDFIVATLT